MAKDPAFLFYTGDFSTGTQFFSDEQVGKYLRLLMAQHQHGRLTEQQMNHICKTYDKDVYNKFTKDADGLFYNERLEYEIDKRRNYSKSRAANRSNPNKDINNISVSYDSHMENENENRIINKDEKPKKKIKEFIPPTISDVKQYFLENGYSEQIAEKAFNYYSIADWHDSKGSKIKNWKQKMVANWFKEENKIPLPPFKNEFGLPPIERKAVL